MDTARPAQAADLPELARLWNEAVGELAGLRGGEALADTLRRADLEDYLLSAVGSAEHMLVVGLIDQTPVGIASMRAKRDLEHPVGDLELIYVEPGARRVGVADTMLALVASQGRLWGLTGIDGPALPGDRAAKSFFEAHGYTARLLVMHRRIGTPSE